MAPPSSRKQSIAESVEKTFDKNTVILIVNLLILVLLMSLLYVVASSALGAHLPVCTHLRFLVILLRFDQPHLAFIYRSVRFTIAHFYAGPDE
uniref:Uncharacterized protein n=1 Tax=Plectus sambesii TaxID=2011161 RepID=A0A914XLQ8_9BILA